MQRVSPKNLPPSHVRKFVMPEQVVTIRLHGLQYSTRPRKGGLRDHLGLGDGRPLHFMKYFQALPMWMRETLLMIGARNQSASADSRR